MRKYSKKMISVVVLVSFLISLFPIVAFAGDKDVENNDAMNAENVESIMLIENIMQYLEVGTTKQYTVKIFPETISPEQAGLTWTSSNPEVGTIDSNGNFIAKAKGKTEIEVKTANGKVAEAIVHVWPAGSPTHIAFTNPTNYPLLSLCQTNYPNDIINPNASITIGNTFKIGVKIYPENAKQKTYTLTSLNPSIATVDSDGNIKGIANGLATIRVTCDANGIYKDISVGVKNPSSTSSLRMVSSNENMSNTAYSAHQIGLNQTDQLKVYTYPDYTLLSPSEVVFTNRGENIEIDAYGNIKGKALSEFDVDIITVKLKSNPNISGVTHMQCVDSNTLSVSNTNVVLYNAGDQKRKVIDVYWTRPNVNLIQPSIGSSVNGSLISIDAPYANDTANPREDHGTLTIKSGNKTGQTIIPVTYGGKTININVKVLDAYKSPKVGYFNEYVKTVYQLNEPFDNRGIFCFAPADNLANWVGTYMQFVNVEGFDTSTVGEHKAKVSTPYLYGNGYEVVEAYLHYTVVQPVESIEIVEKDKTSLEVGESTQYTAILKPDENINETVTWESSDTTVATITEDGLVTALTPGTATITVIAASGVKDSIVITVEGNIEGISLEGLKDVYELNEALAVQGNIVVTYKDGSTDAIPFTADMISAFDTTSVGAKIAHVTYDGFVADYHYTVIDPAFGGDAMTEILSEKGVQTLMGEAINKFYNKEGIYPKTGGLDSTGPNFGQDIKAAVMEILGIETGNFDFRIYRNGYTDAYKIYLFDLNGKAEGDTVGVTGFQYQNGEVSEPTAIQDITVISKSTEDASGNFVQHLTINAEEFIW